MLYATFASPWAEEPATPEPQFNLPSCYFLQPPPLKPMHLKNFQLETLFYIFYSMPQDVLQASITHLFQTLGFCSTFKCISPKQGCSSKGYFFPKSRAVEFSTIKSVFFCRSGNLSLVGGSGFSRRGRKKPCVRILCALSFKPIAYFVPWASFDIMVEIRVTLGMQFRLAEGQTTHILSRLIF